MSLASGCGEPPTATSPSTARNPTGSSLTNPIRSPLSGMIERQLMRVQEKPLHLQPLLPASIDRIPHHRTTNESHVRANLMRPPGQQLEPHQGAVALKIVIQHFKFGLRPPDLPSRRTAMRLRCRGSRAIGASTTPVFDAGLFSNSAR